MLGHPSRSKRPLTPTLWPNRDPIGEPGFETLRYHNNKPLRITKTIERLRNRNLYGFVRNRPTTYYDSFGLEEQGPQGPDSLACKTAIEQAEAALELAEAEPSDENIEAALLASMYAALVCSPPKPPPTPPWKTVCRVAGRAGAIAGAGAVGAFTGYWIRNDVNYGCEVGAACFWDWWYGNPPGSSFPPGPQPY